jgi:hypothetical protein
MSLTERGQKNPISTLSPLFSKIVSSKTPGWTGKTLAALYQNIMDRVIGEVAAMYDKKAVQLDCQGAVADLAETTIRCRPVDERLLNTYLSYLIGVGFLRAPRFPSSVRDSSEQVARSISIPIAASVHNS